MKVFADLHHSDLYYSLYLLFEERLGWELYRPIGMEWFTRGYWKIAEPYGNKMDTVGQFLDINDQGWDQEENLNGEHYEEGDVYRVFDPGHDYHHRAITLEVFKSMDFDVVMPTYEAHDSAYTILRNKYQPQAKLIAQMGNTGQLTDLPNVLHTVPYIPKPGQNAIYYHQEIDPDHYKYVPPNPSTKNIFSMVNCLPYEEIFYAYKDALPEVDMRAYGADCPDGALFGSAGVSAMMRKANIGWHLKPQDGFGHTAMGWFASGRPVVTYMSDVVGFGGEAPDLFESGVTCLDLQAHSFGENCHLIREMLYPPNNLEWSERVLKRFREIINYDEEADNIKQFLEEIL